MMTLDELYTMEQDAILWYRSGGEEEDAIAEISAVIGFACIEIARELKKQNERWGKLTRDE